MRCISCRAYPTVEFILVVSPSTIARTIVAFHRDYLTFRVPRAERANEVFGDTTLALPFEDTFKTSSKLPNQHFLEVASSLLAIMVETMSSRQANSDASQNLNQQDTTRILFNRILAWVVSLIESPTMRVVETRISNVLCSGWLPGKGDAKLIAALTNRPESSIAEIVGNTPRPKFQVGRQAFYSIEDFAIPKEMSTGKDEAAP